MTAKYQIFISSTYKDLKDERDQVIKAVLQMGHIPVAMEMFSAADEEQWKVITKQLDHIDYYVVIVAHRYGSIAPDGISYTEKEFDYACKKGIPVLGFIIDEAAAWPNDKRDKENTHMLESFKNKIKQRLIKMWNTKDELYGHFAISLGTAINTHPRDGWIKASEAAKPDVLNELSRLSIQNEELRNNLNKYQNNSSLCISATDIGAINNILQRIGVRNNYGAYIELRGPHIREFQDKCMSHTIARQTKLSNSLIVLAFDITKDPQIWLDRSANYLSLNAELIAARGTISRVLFVEKHDFLDNVYREKLYKLIKKLNSHKVDTALIFMSSGDYYEDFIVFPELCVLKEIYQPSKDNAGGASIAFFDDESILRFREKFPVFYNTQSKATADQFITNYTNDIPGKKLLDILIGG